MQEAVPPFLRQSVERVIDMLVKKQYGELAALTGEVRLSTDEIARAIRSYGCTLTYPSPEAFALMTVVPIVTTALPSWSVVVPLWTREEGRSDLSIELRVIQEGDSIQIELDSIHVL